MAALSPGQPSVYYSHREMYQRHKRFQTVTGTPISNGTLRQKQSRGGDPKPHSVSSEVFPAELPRRPVADTRGLRRPCAPASAWGEVRPRQRAVTSPGTSRAPVPCLSPAARPFPYTPHQLGHHEGARPRLPLPWA